MGSSARPRLAWKECLTHQARQDEMLPSRVPRHVRPVLPRCRAVDSEVHWRKDGRSFERQPLSVSVPLPLTPRNRPRPDWRPVAGFCVYSYFNIHRVVLCQRTTLCIWPPTLYFLYKVWYHIVW